MTVGCKGLMDKIWVDAFLLSLREHILSKYSSLSARGTIKSQPVVSDETIKSPS